MCYQVKGAWTSNLSKDIHYLPKVRNQRYRATTETKYMFTCDYKLHKGDSDR
jgi:hypothetical protein